jgi:hypothetical protein
MQPILSYSVFGLALLGAWLGIAPTPQAQASIPQAQVLLAQSAALDRLPATKTVTVLVEGEPQAMVMQLYQHPEVPLVTYYPPTLTPDQSCDADGCGVSFMNESMGVGVIFFFPAGVAQATDVAPYVTGPEGLIAGNEWVITGTYTDQLNFPWARQMVTFQTPGLAATGLAYLGEASGRGFAAMAVFPPDAGDGFMPQVNAIFSEVQVKP